MQIVGKLCSSMNSNTKSMIFPTMSHVVQLHPKQISNTIWFLQGVIQLYFKISIFLGRRWNITGRWSSVTWVAVIRWLTRVKMVVTYRAKMTHIACKNQRIRLGFKTCWNWIFLLTHKKLNSVYNNNSHCQRVTAHIKREVRNLHFSPPDGACVLA